MLLTLSTAAPPVCKGAWPSSSLLSSMIIFILLVLRQRLLSLHHSDNLMSVHDEAQDGDVLSTFHNDIGDVFKDSMEEMQSPISVTHQKVQNPLECSVQVPEFGDEFAIMGVFLIDSRLV